VVNVDTMWLLYRRTSDSSRLALSNGWGLQFCSSVEHRPIPTGTLILYVDTSTLNNRSME